MKRNRKNKNTAHIGLDEYIKIQRAFSRQEEFDRMGPGFHSKSRIHESSKIYNRRLKHKGLEDY